MHSKISKNLLLLALLLGTISNANAYQNKQPRKSGLYLGVDMIRSFTQHKYLSEQATEDGEPITVNGYYSNGQKNGFGFNLGYKAAARRLFVAPEIFYEQLNNSAKDFGSDLYPSTSGHRLEVNNRYGAKVNLGYNLFANLNIFASAGLANVAYAMNLYSVNHTRKGVVQASPIYGGGLSYDLNNHWIIKASYDWQQFITRFDYAFEKDRIVLQTVKAGIAYKF